MGCSKHTLIIQAQKLSHYQELSLNCIKTCQRLDFSSVSTTKWAQEYNKYVLNILCATEFVTSSLALFQAAIWVKSTHLIKSCLKTRKKRKYENKRNFYMNLHLKDFRSFTQRIHSLLQGQLMPERALTSSTVYDVYRNFEICASSIVIKVKK